MIAEYFCRGLLIGLIFGVPAGAIGALTIGRTLEKGFFAGFLTGIGSSTADLIYSCVGVFGITVISDFLSARQNTLQVIGGILILLFGVGILCKKEPVTVLSFMAAFAAFGIHGGLSAKQGAALIVGILTGTLCWWLVLSGITAHFRDRITGKIYRWLNCVLGCLMTGFGMVMVVQGIVK